MLSRMNQKDREYYEKEDLYWYGICTVCGVYRYLCEANVNEFIYKLYVERKEND